MKAFLKTHNLSYEYLRRDDEGNVEGIIKALSDININVNRGEFITILGHNGSGKSTFAKQLNAILHPTEGSVYIDELDTTDAKYLWDIRQKVGMVFQNPDNQIVAQTVEEDVAFGPENMGVPTKEIEGRVREALQMVGMQEYVTANPYNLSGGQKQRISIAGVLAMHPSCIVFDEPTAMLDPVGRRDVIRAARALNDVEKITIILITHYMEEAIYSDKIFVIDNGKIAMQGTPKEVFSDIERLKELRLTVPKSTLLAHELKNAGLEIPDGVLDSDELVNILCNM